MLNLLMALIAGLIFGIGLLVSGMDNPAKVIGFLDLAGNWDPSLIFVMAGAIAIASAGFSLAKRRTVSLLHLSIQLPASKLIDKRLIGGSALFGIGWGLAGICPGPALVLCGIGLGKGFLFAGAMLTGMAIFEYVLPKNTTPPTTSAGAANKSPHR